MKKGEILGIAGVDGNGQTELAEALIGLRKLDAGEIYLNGEKISALDVKQHRAKHIGYIPEDRNTRGLWQERTIRENLAALPLHQKQMAKLGIIDRKAVTAYAETAAEQGLTSVPGALDIYAGDCPAAMRRRSSLPEKCPSRLRS